MGNGEGEMEKGNWGKGNTKRELGKRENILGRGKKSEKWKIKSYT